MWGIRNGFRKQTSVQPLPPSAPGSTAGSTRAAGFPGADSTRAAGFTRAAALPSSVSFADPTLLAGILLMPTVTVTPLRAVLQRRERVSIDTSKHDSSKHHSSKHHSSDNGNSDNERREGTALADVQYRSADCADQSRDTLVSLGGDVLTLVETGPAAAANHRDATPVEAFSTTSTLDMEAVLSQRSSHFQVSQKSLQRVSWYPGTRDSVSLNAAEFVASELFSGRFSGLIALFSGRVSGRHALSSGRVSGRHTEALSLSDVSVAAQPAQPASRWPASLQPVSKTQHPQRSTRFEEQEGTHITANTVTATTVTATRSCPGTTGSSSPNGVTGTWFDLHEDEGSRSSPGDTGSTPDRLTATRVNMHEGEVIRNSAGDTGCTPNGMALPVQASVVQEAPVVQAQGVRSLMLLHSLPHTVSHSSSLPEINVPTPDASLSSSSSGSTTSSSMLSGLSLRLPGLPALKMQPGKGAASPGKSGAWARRAAVAALVPQSSAREAEGSWNGWGRMASASLGSVRRSVGNVLSRNGSWIRQAVSALTDAARPILRAEARVRSHFRLIPSFSYSFDYQGLSAIPKNLPSPLP